MGFNSEFKGLKCSKEQRMY